MLSGMTKHIKMHVKSKMYPLIANPGENTDTYTHTHTHTLSLSLSHSHRASSSYSSEGQSSSIPPINVTPVIEGKLSGHLKRRYHDQALKKLVPLLQRFSSKQPFEVLVVELKTGHLSALAAECNVCNK